MVLANMLVNPRPLPIGQIIAQLEADGGRLSLSDHASMSVDASQYRGSPELLAALRSREMEAISLLYNRCLARTLSRPCAMLRPAAIPVSIAQKQWVEFDRVAPHAQWISAFVRLSGRVNVEKLEDAYLETIAQNEIMRSVYRRTPTGFEQEILPAHLTRLEACDLTQLSAEEQQKAMTERSDSFLSQPQRYMERPIHFCLFRLSRTECILGGIIHHIAYDNVSSNLFVKEILSRYYAHLLGFGTSRVNDLQYADFALWEQNWLTPDIRNISDAFWARHLSTATPMGFSKRKNAVDTSSGRFNVTIAGDVFQEVKAFARTLGCSVSTLVLSGLALLLGRIAGQNQALFRAMCFGRSRGFEKLIGCFSQARPFHVRFEDNPSFLDLIGRSLDSHVMGMDVRRPIASLPHAARSPSVTINFLHRNDADLMQAPSAIFAEAASHDRVVESEQVALMPPPYRLGMRAQIAYLPRSAPIGFPQALNFGITQTKSELFFAISHPRDFFQQTDLEMLMLDLQSILSGASISPQDKVLDAAFRSVSFTQADA